VRLSSTQLEVIKRGIIKICGQSAKLWLFGSRVDDTKKGGDIDLYVEVEPQISDFEAKIKLMGFFETHLGEQKIDILIRSYDRPMTAMQEIAKTTGIEIKLI
jgi:predicted nucleotidyltransferase